MIEKVVEPSIQKMEGLKQQFDEVNFYKVKDFSNVIFESEHEEVNKVGDDEFNLTLNSLLKLNKIIQEYQSQRGVLLEVDRFHDDLFARVSSV